MSRNYSEEEKRGYLDSYKMSGKTKTAYARENNIPEATFRAWVNEEKYMSFGAIEINPTANQVVNKIIKQSTVFSNENIRIELKEGFDKEFLKRIVEVLIHDK